MSPGQGVAGAAPAGHASFPRMSAHDPTDSKRGSRLIAFAILRWPQGREHLRSARVIDPIEGADRRRRQIGPCPYDPRQQHHAVPGARASMTSGDGASRSRLTSAGLASGLPKRHGRSGSRVKSPQQKLGATLSLLSPDPQSARIFKPKLRTGLQGALVLSFVQKV
jgi:hypothetical protein